MTLPDTNVLITSGTIATLLSTLGLVVIAILNNKKERKSAAEASMESALRERIMLRDEQISHRDEQIGSLKQDKIDLIEEKADLLERIRVLESNERSRDRA